MDRLAISACAAFLAALCALNLLRFRGWRLCTAIAQVPADRHIAYTGQKIEISYRARDGRPLTSQVTLLDGRSGPPKAGTEIVILYDPQSPTSVVSITIPALLAAGGAVMVFVAAAPWLR